MNLSAPTQAAVEALAQELGCSPDEAIHRAVALAGMMRGLLWVSSPMNPEGKPHG